MAFIYKLDCIYSPSVLLSICMLVQTMNTKYITLKNQNQMKKYQNKQTDRQTSKILRKPLCIVYG